MTAPTTSQRVSQEAEKARAALVERDSLIRLMRTEGATFRAIAAAAGLSPHGVEKIVAKGR